MRCADRRPRGWLAAMLWVCVVGAGYAADSGVDGINLQTYAPAIDGAGFLNANGPRLLHAGELTLKLDTHAAGGGPFIVALGGTPVRLLDRVVTANLLAAVGLNDGVTLAVDLPYHLLVQGVNAGSLASYRNSALGDIRLALKFRLLEERSRRPGIALLLQNTIPTGDPALFTGATGMVPGGELIVGKSFKWFRFATSLGAQFPRQKTVLGSTFDDRLTYAVGVELPVHFWDGRWSVVSTVHGSIDTRLTGQNGRPVEWLMGVRKQFKNGMDVTVAGGGGFDRAIGNPQWRAVVSVGYTGTVRSSRADASPAVAPTAAPVPAQAPAPPACSRAVAAALLQPVTVHYRTGAAQPDREQAGWLIELAQQWRSASAPLPLQIAAHDGTPGADGRRMAAWRAMRVRQVLRAEGIPAQQCTIRNMGNAEPLGDGRTASGAVLNRRVTVSPATPR